MLIEYIMATNVIYLVYERSFKYDDEDSICIETYLVY